MTRDERARQVARYLDEDTKLEGDQLVLGMGRAHLLIGGELADYQRVINSVQREFEQLQDRKCKIPFSPETRGLFVHVAAREMMAIWDRRHCFCTSGDEQKALWCPRCNPP